MRIAQRKPQRSKTVGKEHAKPTGLLRLVGAFDDAPEFADVLDAIVKSRRGEGLSESTPRRRRSLSSRA